MYMVSCWETACRTEPADVQKSGSGTLKAAHVCLETDGFQGFRIAIFSGQAFVADVLLCWRSLCCSGE
jgi:hypothetical protein